jgi:dTDP-4-amino-4,6-dideoxygalactose transaminase
VTAAAPEGGHPEIPVFDIRVEQEDLDAVEEALRGGWWTMGPRVEALEEEFAERIGSAHGVALSSCTTALHLALLCAGVGPGDEVILPSFTFVATAAAVLYCGAVPVFADICGEHDLGIDPELVERALTPKTRAVIPVHYAGFPAAADRIGELCDARGIVMVEDCAHAPAASLGGRNLGSLGFAGCFSFFSNKVLSAGEGGMLITDDLHAATRARSLRNQGLLHNSLQRHEGTAPRYDVLDVGFNYRIDEMRAALISSRMRRLDQEVERRRELMHRYRKGLRGMKGVDVPYTDEGVDESSCYTLAVLVDPEERDAVRTRMGESGVQTTLAYTGVHEFSFFRELQPRVSLPRTESVGRRIINLPLFPHLTEDEQDHVLEVLEASLR